MNLIDLEDLLHEALDEVAPSFSVVVRKNREVIVVLSLKEGEDGELIDMDEEIEEDDDPPLGLEEEDEDDV
jgi:hypothetical protein